MTATSSPSTRAEHPRPRRAVRGLAVRGLAVGALTALLVALAPGRAASATAPTSAPPYKVGEEVLHFVDPTRTIRYPGHSVQPRPLVTVVRYPQHARGPFPLIVFGHGFAVTPAYYFRLLRSWAQAGFVVAAPVFPLENEHAPGGPNESDLGNEPRDMSVVITRMLAISAGHSGPLAGLINPRQVAVSGQSDGAMAALAAAYNRDYRDTRIRAAVILSGAEFGGQSRLYFPPGSPPLLASQGTADTSNEPIYTYRYFDAARRPKYLLQLLGAPHLPPYTYEQPQLSIVGRVSTDFLDHYLKGTPGSLGRMRAAGNVAGVAALTARP
jgi:dienelactone hydrolase